MPPYKAFKSKAQMRMAFSGGMGEGVKEEAREKAHATPNIHSLPDHVRKTASGAHRSSSDSIRGKAYRKK